VNKCHNMIGYEVVTWL